MNSVTWEVGEDYILPECDFTPPAGKTFDYWEVSLETGGAGYTYPTHFRSGDIIVMTPGDFASYDYIRVKAM